MLARLIGNLLLTLFLSNFLYAGQEMKLTGSYQRNIQIVVDRGYEEERKKEAEDNQPIILRSLEGVQNYAKALMRNPRQATEFEVADNVRLVPQLICAYIMQETDIEVDFEKGQMLAQFIERDSPNEYRNLSHWLVEIHYLQQQEERENEPEKKEKLQYQMDFKGKKIESKFKNFVIKKKQEQFDKLFNKHGRIINLFDCWACGYSLVAIVVMLGQLSC